MIEIRKGSILKTSNYEYKLKKRIASGGNSIVYSIWKDGEEYAVKVLKVPCKDSCRNRFRNEVEIQKNLEHKNIVKIIDSGEYKKGNNDVIIPFYIMKKYTSNMQDIINSEKDILKLLKYYIDLCKAVRYAHNKGIYHRDIKPENCLYDKVNDMVLLSDFGISHNPKKNITTDWEKLHNDKYAAPEQRAGSKIKVGKSSDIFALGLILNQLFTKEVPLGLDYTTISDVYPAYGRLDQVVSNMIKYYPKDRIKTLSDVINNIDDIRKNLGKKINDIESLLRKNNVLDDGLLVDLAGDFMYLDECINDNKQIRSKKINDSKYRFSLTNEFENTIILWNIKEIIEDFIKIESKQPSSLNDKLIDNVLNNVETNKDVLDEFKEYLFKLDSIDANKSIQRYCYKLFRSLHDYHKDQVLSYAKKENIVDSTMTYSVFYNYLYNFKKFGIFDDDIAIEKYVVYYDDKGHDCEEYKPKQYDEILKEKINEKTGEDITILRIGSKYKIIYGSEKNKKFIENICREYINDKYEAFSSKAKSIIDRINNPDEKDNSYVDEYDIRDLCFFISQNNTAN